MEGYSLKKRKALDQKWKIGELEIGNTLTVDSDLFVSGLGVFGGSISTSANFNVSGDIYPTANGTASIGTDTLHFKEIFVDDIYSGAITPFTDNVYDIGTSLLRFSDIYFGGKLYGGTGHEFRNYVPSKADGGRLSNILFKGTTELNTCTQMGCVGFAHDGEDDDHKSYFQLKLNKGSIQNGVAQYLKITPDQFSFYIGRGTPALIFDIQSSGCNITGNLLLSGDLGSSENKVSNIYCDNVTMDNAYFTTLDTGVDSDMLFKRNSVLIGTLGTDGLTFASGKMVDVDELRTSEIDSQDTDSILLKHNNIGVGAITSSGLSISSTITTDILSATTVTAPTVNATTVSASTVSATTTSSSFVTCTTIATESVPVTDIYCTTLHADNYPGGEIDLLNVTEIDTGEDTDLTIKRNGTEICKVTSSGFETAASKYLYSEKLISTSTVLNLNTSDKNYLIFEKDPSNPTFYKHIYPDKSDGMEVWLGAPGASNYFDNIYVEDVMNTQSYLYLKSNNGIVMEKSGTIVGQFDALGLTMVGDILTYDGTDNVGTTGTRFNNIYGTTLHGITGNITTGNITTVNSSTTNVSTKLDLASNADIECSGSNEIGSASLPLSKLYVSTIASPSAGEIDITCTNFIPTTNNISALGVPSKKWNSANISTGYFTAIETTDIELAEGGNITSVGSNDIGTTTAFFDNVYVENAHVHHVVGHDTISNYLLDGQSDTSTNINFLGFRELSNDYLAVVPLKASGNYYDGFAELVEQLETSFNRASKHFIYCEGSNITVGRVYSYPSNQIYVTKTGHGFVADGSPITCDVYYLGGTTIGSGDGYYKTNCTATYDSDDAFVVNFDHTDGGNAGEWIILSQESGDKVSNTYTTEFEAIVNKYTITRATGTANFHPNPTSGCYAYDSSGQIIIGTLNSGWTEFGFTGSDPSVGTEFTCTDEMLYTDFHTFGEGSGEGSYLGLLIGEDYKLILNDERFYPYVHDEITCGEQDHAFSDIYSVNAVTTTSDKRYKKEITESNLGLNFISKLKPVSYKWLNKGKRPHYGFIAQDVAASLSRIGVDFGGYVLKDSVQPSSKASLRYSEFIAPIVKSIQELVEQINELKVENKLLHERIDQISEIL